MISDLNTYVTLKNLSERVKFDITVIKCTILDQLCINFIQNLLSEPYQISFEDEHKLLDLINKLKSHDTIGQCC